VSVALKDRILLFRDGRSVFDRDNWDITGPAVAAALEGQFARVGVASGGCPRNVHPFSASIPGGSRATAQ
jgi:hypothetical protein